MTGGHFRDLTDLAMKSRLPAIAADRSFAEAGLLMTYGVDGVALGKPRGLCRQDPEGRQTGRPAYGVGRQVRFGVNLKTAKAFGLTIPPAVLARADEIIEK